MKSFKQKQLLSLMVLSVFFLGISAVSAGTYAISYPVQIYDLSLNKSTYTANESIIVSGSLIQRYCICTANGGWGANLYAQNNLNGASAILYQLPGRSGTATFNSGPSPTSSGIAFFSYYLNQSYLVTIPYTVVAPPAPAVNLYFSYLDEVKSFLRDIFYV